MNENYFSQDCLFQRGRETRIMCTSIFEIKHKHKRKIFIPLCTNSTDRYHLNKLKIIAIIYHNYIEYKLYNLEYTKI